MKYPNIKRQQGEQEDVNQRRYDDDTIEIDVGTNQMTRTQEGQDEYDDPTEIVRNDPDSSRKGDHVETP